MQARSQTTTTLPPLRTTGHQQRAHSTFLKACRTRLWASPGAIWPPTCRCAARQSMWTMSSSRTTPCTAPCS
eukprot:scaffold180420_cov27-Prasinocladus_malaysianus.AAC.1